MKTTILTVIAAMCASSATAQTDSIATDSFPELHLNEVVVTGRRPALRQKDGKLVYIVKNDPYSQGLDGIQVLDRIPRVSSTDGNVSVAGKGNVRYIIDGILMELDATAMKARLQNLRAENIEKIELITTLRRATPPRQTPCTSPSPRATRPSAHAAASTARSTKASDSANI